MHIGTICIQIVPMCTRNGACTWVRAGQPSSDQSGVVKPKAVYVRGLKAKADQFLRKHVRLCLRPRGKVAPKHALSDSMNGFCGIGLTNVRTAQKGKRDPFDCKQSLVLGGITATQGQGRHIARQRAGGRVTRLRLGPHGEHLVEIGRKNAYLVLEIGLSGDLAAVKGEPPRQKEQPSLFFISSNRHKY